MAVALSPKSPVERFDYSWTPQLDAGDTISGTPTVSVLAGGVTTAGLAVEGSGTRIRFFVEGGTAGTAAEVRIVANTVGGRTFEEVVVIAIEAGSPLIADFRLRYPEFAAVPDASVEYWMTDAERFVTDAWAQADYAPAIMAHAAHSLAITGLGTAAALPQGVTSFRSGSFSATVTDAQANADGLASTRYGREFMAMQRRNLGGPFGIMLGVLPR